MRKINLCLLVLLFLVMLATGCGDVAPLQSQLDSLSSENSALASENTDLKNQNENLTDQVAALESEVAAYEAKESEQKIETTVQDGDAVIKLLNKTSETNQYGQYYARLVFSVTNNTSKTIQGVQGIAKFSDLFGVEIISTNCDFTGKTIDPSSTVEFGDLSFECNQFIDNNMKLYNTAYGDLQFEYTVKSIVFTDGTSKTVS